MVEEHKCKLSVLLALGLSAPFLGKPPHIDDANFLRLAEGARLDPWRPHAVEINWQGTTETAFDVLSNPPGIAWWLAPVVESPPWVQHLWMLPWLLLALWGAHQLGRALAGKGTAMVLLLGTAPLVVLATQALTPDLPLLALSLAGLGGFLCTRRAHGFWAIVAGSSLLFRYSGLCMVPLLLFAGLQRGKTRAAALSALPLLLLVLHDLSAYGEVHILAMTGFQSVATTPWELFRKPVVSLAMLGGAGILPILAWRRESIPYLLVGGALGAIAASVSGLPLAPALATVGFTAAGGVTLSALSWEQRDDRLLLAWGLGGLAFLLTLRFTAGRYWIPFLAPFALAALRREGAHKRLPIAVGCSAMLSLGMATDDYAMATAHQKAAQMVTTLGKTTYSALGEGSFAGHWGWQHHMEKAGWTPLEDEQSPGPIHATSEAAWPQDPNPERCMREQQRLDFPDTFWGPRVHSAAGYANLHGFLIAGKPPLETYLPWTLANDPYDRIRIYLGCEHLADEG